MMFMFMTDIWIVDSNFHYSQMAYFILFNIFCLELYFDW